jgi:Mg2+-importing ATPase
MSVKSADIAKLPQEKVYRTLRTSPQGLTQKEAERRIKDYGENRLRNVRNKSVLRKYAETFKSPLIIILLLVSFLSFFIGEPVNGAIIIVMVTLSTILNFTQEERAHRVANELKKHLALSATVIRGGEQKTIPASKVVPGDVIVLSAGNLIPADARIIESKDCFVTQSSLTGESFPAEKHSFPRIDSNGSIFDTIVYAGTSIVTGEAKAVVYAIGIQTEIASISSRSTLNTEPNEFEHGMQMFAKFITKIVIIFVLAIFAINVLFKQDFLTSLTFAIAVAVGLTPEFLPMIITVTVSRGALLMSKNGVIVKNLIAIPTLGSMNILATDKTGTLTENSIRLVKFVNVLGEQASHVLTFAQINSFFETGIANPLDEAIKRFESFNTNAYTKIDEIPFDFTRKRLSIIVEKQNECIMVSKGAPEELFKVSTDVYIHGKKESLTDIRKQEALKEYYQLSSEGYRVLAISVKTVPKQKRFEPKDEHHLTLYGFVAFLDPVKKGVRHAIDKLENIGIQIKIITGDNEQVSERICNEAGIISKGTITGNHLEQLTEKELIKAVSTYTIFARCSPVQKERIILALKKTGNTVGYLGDGINDAPSLTAADIGISVNNAVDIAQESADLILTKKSLLVLSNGVIEGRKTFGNTMKYIMMGLSSNFGNMFSMVGATLFLPFLPMLPLQILLNNFLYDLSQLTIPTDAIDKEYIQQPKSWDIPFLKKFMITMGSVSSLFDFIIFFILFQLYKTQPSFFQTGWFIESIATQVFVIYVIRTKKIPFLQSSPSKLLLVNTLVIVSIAWILPFIHIGRLFSFTPLSIPILLSIACLVVIYLFTAEAVKQIFYKFLSRK